MGFQIIDQGMRVPLTAGTFTTPRRRVERVQYITKDAKVERQADDFPGQEQREREKQKPQNLPKQVYQKTEYPQQRNSFQADRIMSSPVLTVLPETRLDEAWEIIREQRFRHLPILTSDKKLVGIISDRDLLREAAHREIARDIPPAGHHVQKVSGTGEKANDGRSNTDNNKPSSSKKTVLDICKRRILTATPDTELREIAKILIEEHIGAMPIVDENGNLLGMITRSDVLRAIVVYGVIDLLI
ncbi:MAG: CBS domain-containing protein [Planctomycetes bacterium]|nr:CBS domain-containing protein [Planctomycetota bacterium]